MMQETLTYLNVKYFQYNGCWGEESYNQIISWAENLTATLPTTV